MANYPVELAVKVTDAVIIEVYEVEASSPEDAAQWLLLNDEEARLVSSYVSDEGVTMTEEVIACFRKIPRKRLEKVSTH